MNDHTRDTDDVVDRAASGIARSSLDAETEGRITDRVWRKIAAAGPAHAPLRDCADFQREIPAFLEGSLPEGRALLVDDHTRHCVPCRRALMQHRGELAPAAPRPSAPHRARRVLLRAAAAVLAVAAGGAGVYVAGNIAADRGLRATVATVDGSLRLVDAELSGLEQGRELRAHQALRTARDSGAFIRLADGSMVEMNERTEIALRASRRGTTVELARGNIIVHAAEQHDGRLFVATADCVVAVRGTIFAVNHGLKGSRVSVLEGEVEVRDGTATAFLRPGDQLTTSDRLHTVPLEEEIAWSRDASTHRQLLAELEGLRKAVAEAIDSAPPRTSTRLLDLAPADTMVYAAMPNITDGLAEARAAFQDRLRQSPVLAQWWQERVTDTGVETEINDLLDHLQPLGDALGAEAALAVPASVLHGTGTPLFLAELVDPAAFRAEIAVMIEEAEGNAGDLMLVDDPATAVAGDAELVLWVADDLVAAAANLEALRTLAARLDDPAMRDFTGSRLHGRLAEAYAGGVSWLMGVDLARAFADAATEMPAEGSDVMARLGFADAETLIIERHRDGDWYATDAELLFSGPRRGIAAWLADPAPMGSLEFVSPQAYLAASAVTRDAADMFDELLGLVAAEDDAALAELRRFEDRIGIDLRDDLAATFGGEAAFALDGPMVPVPSWKLIVEVYDSATLLHTLERAVAQLNSELAAQGEAALVFETEDSAGRTYATVRRDGLAGRAVFTFAEGYLVAGPSRAVVDQAIAQRASGVTLAGSGSFRSMLPDNGSSDCSALVYRDLEALVEAVPAELLQEMELASAVGDGLSTGLVCVFAGPDRITASASGGSLLSLGTLLGLHGAGQPAAAGDGTGVEKIGVVRADKAVSSRG